MFISNRFIHLAFALICIMSSSACGQVKEGSVDLESRIVEAAIIPGAEQLHSYIELLKGKEVGLIVNQTSRVADVHLVDTLLSMDISIKSIFAPEHGFRGEADAGEYIVDGIDATSGLPLISLYGKNKKPTADQLKGIDLLVFDIQDVGARFYTYISTLHYIMEAGAENGIPVIVLDRPNPNAHYIDGPVLEPSLKSFVGMHPVPVVYGMTIGEYAMMINGESWLAGGLKSRLQVIPCQHYNHDLPYDLPIKPSPNLPNSRSIALYPSLCFFEGTKVSIGRGTAAPFEQVGHPEMDIHQYSFTPVSTLGAKYPKWQDQECYGLDLTELDLKDIRQQRKLDLSYIIDAYGILAHKKVPFFIDNNFFDKLAGTAKLKQQILRGVSEDQIRASWQEDLNQFKKIRNKYLLYK